jgi:hypothetical protein
MAISDVEYAKTLAKQIYQDHENAYSPKPPFIMAENQLEPTKIFVFDEGKSYGLPMYEVTDDGVKLIENQIQTQITTVNFCKGSKADATIPRQEGVFVEAVIQLAITHLQAVNKGDLASRETSLAITKLEEALMWLEKRQKDRQKRGVAQTYNK